MYYKNDSVIMREETLIPVKVNFSENVTDSHNLLKERAAVVSFGNKNMTVLNGRGAKLLLDFGKEIAGGVRIFTREAGKNSRLHLRFGESYSEAITPLNEKNTTNDHSPRDFTVAISAMSDLTFGETGFRFIYIELIDDAPVILQNIYAVLRTQQFDFEGCVETSDEDLNRILNTAVYTLKLNFRNGCIWDGIKRDRLVWSGDLNQEIITSLYMFGNTPNIKNSLEFLKNDTEKDCWINDIPSYSAWWIINLCDYVGLTGDKEFFMQNKAYAEDILKLADESISENGDMSFGRNAGMPFYLDWPTYETEDAVIGAAAVFLLAAEKYLFNCKSDYAEAIIKKLSPYLKKSSNYKQIAAFQILAGAKSSEQKLSLLEEGGAKGFSTFMSYYILKALAKCGSEKTVDIIKAYFGGMLSRGATTFWEDFDIEWLNGSGRIDCETPSGINDIHGDYGRYCYENFRHSLCHGWSAGIVAFFVEEIIGLKPENGWKKLIIKPNISELSFINAKLATPYGALKISIGNGKIDVIQVPKEIEIVY